VVVDPNVHGAEFPERLRPTEAVHRPLAARDVPVV